MLPRAIENHQRDCIDGPRLKITSQVGVVSLVFRIDRGMFLAWKFRESRHRARSCMSARRDYAVLNKQQIRLRPRRSDVGVSNPRRRSQSALVSAIQGNSFRFDRLRLGKSRSLTPVQRPRKSASASCFSHSVLAYDTGEATSIHHLAVTLFAACRLFLLTFIVVTHFKQIELVRFHFLDEHRRALTFDSLHRPITLASIEQLRLTTDSSGCDTSFSLRPDGMR